MQAVCVELPSPFTEELYTFSLWLMYILILILILIPLIRILSLIQIHVFSIEKGHIYFFYRPKVDHKEAKSVDDVQRLEIVLTPGTRGKATSTSKKNTKKLLNRLLIVPRKVMPNVNRRDRYMAMIYGVSDNVDQLNEEFRKEHYSTKTKGERTQEGARLAAEGIE